jgi:hypothetical protein
MEKRNSSLEVLERIHNDFWNDWTFIETSPHAELSRSIEVYFFVSRKGYFTMDVSLEIEGYRYHQSRTMAMKEFCMSQYRFLLRDLAEDISMAQRNRRFNIFRHMVKKEYVENTVLDGII